MDENALRTFRLIARGGWEPLIARRVVTPPPNYRSLIEFPAALPIVHEVDANTSFEDFFSGYSERSDDDLPELFEPILFEPAWIVPKCEMMPVAI